MLYNVAEHFYSIQGEGFWAGTSMYFVRLSQCPVGQHAGICRSWDGRSFICDTGNSYKGDHKAEWHPYTQVNFRLSEDEIWKLARLAGSNRIVVTGGEPLIYDLTPIWKAARADEGEAVHVETSGTVEFDQHVPMWYTVSPKLDYKESCVRWANEIKLLVDEDTREQDVLDKFVRPHKWTFLQPIEEMDNTEQTRRNTCRAMMLVMRHPQKLRLSLQTHKYLEIR